MGVLFFLIEIQVFQLCEAFTLVNIPLFVLKTNPMVFKVHFEFALRAPDHRASCGTTGTLLRVCSLALLYYINSS